MAGSFIDTNVVLYLLSADTDKAERAHAVVAAGGAISVQVLGEVANVARRKLHLPWADLHGFLGALRGLLAVHPVTLEVHAAGLVLSERYGLSIFDATIAAAALEAGCDTLWTEDMQHGMLLGGRLRLKNPFRPE